MKFAIATAFLTLLSVAQRASCQSSSTTTTSAVRPTGSTIKVDVGRNGLTFSPDTVTAAVGDKVEFTFYPRNHSVVQSSFEQPCQPITNAVFSGFFPVASGTSNTTFTVTVANTSPMWLYCSQTTGTHCQVGMAMVINPPNGGAVRNITAYKLLARAASNSTSPARVNGGVLAANSNGAGASTTTTTTGSTSTDMAGSMTTSTTNPTGSTTGATPTTSRSAAGGRESATLQVAGGSLIAIWAWAAFFG